MSYSKPRPLTVLCRNQVQMHPNTAAIVTQLLFKKPICVGHVELFGCQTEIDASGGFAAPPDRIDDIKRKAHGGQQAIT